MDESNATSTVSSEPFLMIGSVPIYFKEDWTTGIGGGLWSTGLAMSQYLQDFASNHVLENLESLYQQNQQQPLALLELGSGHGLLSVCWLALLASQQKQYLVHHLVITDTQEHLPLIQRTLDANSHLTSCDNGSSSSSSSIQITVMDHQWGVWQAPPGNEKKVTDDVHSSNSGNSGNSKNDDHVENLIRNGHYKCDLIFGSDLAYHPDLYQPLLQSLQVFSKHGDANDATITIILIGCTMKDTTPAFFEQARAAGFRYERLAEHLMHAEFRNNFGIFCFQKN